MDTLHRINDEMVAFHCPGCGHAHQVCVSGSPTTGPVWEFNGNFSAPTFTPSIRVRSAQAETQTLCHSFVTHGSIYFLSDCTHHLAGRTVPLPAWSGWEHSA